MSAKLRKYENAQRRGLVLVPALLFMTVAVVAITALLNVAATNVTLVSRDANAELAFQVAEAGIEYYRWHLAHAPTDYTNGTGQPGPYTIPYYDRQGAQIGEFSLEITPPPTGTTVVTITSTGRVTADPRAVRKIRARLAIPSLAQYAVVANATMRFGAGTEVFGPIHSNGGIRFDGLAHNVVSSALAQYNDPDHSGGDEFGVHTHVSPIDPAPPAAVPSRPDVFEAGRQFPVPAANFAGITADLAQIKADAISAGRYFGPSGSQGYHIVLKVDDTFDLYRVISLVPLPNGCIEVLGQQYWGSLSIQSEALLGNYTFPGNGLIFIEDHVWVDGQISTARLTIASGRFPDNAPQRAHITVNADLRYTNYDGQDVIALIVQGNFNAGMASANILRIDAALVAQNGRVGRHYYRPPSGNQNRCSPYHWRDTITLYGMIATNQRYGFAYTDGTGYQTRHIIYDPNLYFGPPPSFPLTSDTYDIISWEEVR